MKTILSDIFFGVGLHAVASFHGYRHDQKRISLVASSRKNAAFASPPARAHLRRAGGGATRCYLRRRCPRCPPPSRRPWWRRPRRRPPVLPPPPRVSTCPSGTSVAGARASGLAIESDRERGAGLAMIASSTEQPEVGGVALFLRADDDERSSGRAPRARAAGPPLAPPLLRRRRHPARRRAPAALASSTKSEAKP